MDKVLYMLQGALELLGYGAGVAVIGWLAIVATSKAQSLRTPALTVVLLGYLYGMLELFTWQDARTLGPIFIGYVGPYTFRSMSAIFYFRSPRPVPGLFFHVMLLTIGPRQHYGAGSWEEIRGRRFDRAIFVDWIKHFLYAAVLIVIFYKINDLWYTYDLPYKVVVSTVLGALMVLEALEIFIDLHLLGWSFFGFFPGFFGRFAFFRARHIGEWWQYWNVPAINSFREIVNWIGMRKSRALSVFAVFFVSGVIHQLLVIAYIRELAWGTMASFLLHGLFVYLFGFIYMKRKKLPKPVRLLLLNQLTTFVVFLIGSSLFALDFLGWYTIPIPWF